MALNWSDELESLPLESLYLLEACHWQWLDTSCFQDEWCTVLAAQPGLGWVMCQKAPQLTPWVQRLLDSGEKQLTPERAGTGASKKHLAALYGGLGDIPHQPTDL